MDDNTLLLSEILQELRTLNHNITIIYGNASHDIQDMQRAFLEVMKAHYHCKFPLRFPLACSWGQSIRNNRFLCTKSEKN